jgi:uracil-DNA glycosylase
MPTLAKVSVPRRFREKGEDCAQCPWTTCDFVAPTLRPGSQILLVDESPGFWDARDGEYFVGESGVVLNEVLKDVGFTREQVSLSNAVKCYDETKATPEILERCSSAFLTREIAYLADKGLKLIIAMGEPALRALIRIAGIAKNRGKVFPYLGIRMLRKPHENILGQGLTAGEFTTSRLPSMSAHKNRGLRRCWTIRQQSL